MREILFPVGRMVGGSLSKLFPVTDKHGAPVMKKGSATEQAMRLNFGVAIAKGAETHWNQTAWGQQIFAEGQVGFPTGEFNAPTFAWKITDGDSQVPNKKGKKPCDKEAYPGHWVIWFSQGWMCKKTDATGATDLTDPEAIKPGHFVQVWAECTDNKPSESPGVYLNPKAVALSGYGEPIATDDVDTTGVGFGQGPLPAGASATPVGMTTPPGTAGVVTPPPTPAPAAGAATPPPPAVTAATDFLTPPPPGPAKTMTAKAAGKTYESFIAAGWNDDQLVAEGYLVIT